MVRSNVRSLKSAQSRTTCMQHSNQLISKKPVNRYWIMTNSERFDENTAAYCPILDDNVAEYTPLSGTVNKII